MTKLFKQAMTDEVFSWNAASNNQGLVARPSPTSSNSISAWRTARGANPDVANDVGFVGAARAADARAAQHVLYNWIIPKHAANPDAAKEFLLYYTENFASATWNSKLYDFPAWAERVPQLDGWLAKDPTGANPADKLAFLKDATSWSTNIGYPGPSNTAIGEVFETVPNMFASAARGEASPKEAVAQAGPRSSRSSRSGASAAWSAARDRQPAVTKVVEVGGSSSSSRAGGSTPWTASTWPPRRAKYLGLLGPSGCGKTTCCAPSPGWRRRARRSASTRRSSATCRRGPQDRHGLPELRPVPAQERPPEHRLPAQGRADGQGRAGPQGPLGGRLLGDQHCWTANPASCRAASASGSPWPGPWSATPTCSCSTSRCRTWTPSCAPAPATARPSSSGSGRPPSSPMTRPRPWAWATGSRSWTTAAYAGKPRRSRSTTTRPTHLRGHLHRLPPMNAIARDGRFVGFRPEHLLPVEHVGGRANAGAVQGGPDRVSLRRPARVRHGHAHRRGDPGHRPVAGHGRDPDRGRGDLRVRRAPRPAAVLRRRKRARADPVGGG